MLFTALLASAFWAMVRGLFAETPRPGAMLCAYQAIALAVLTKGLIGLVLPVLAVGAFLLLTRDWRLFSRLELLRGGAVFLAIAAPWHILVGLKTPDFFGFTSQMSISSGSWPSGLSPITPPCRSTPS